MSTPNQRVRELLSRPSVEALIYALRHPETWPAGFVWDYRACDSCALGLARELWHSIFDADVPFVARAIFMPVPDAQLIFEELAGDPDLMTMQEFYHKLGAISPEHVASALERWLEERG